MTDEQYHFLIQNRYEFASEFCDRYDNENLIIITDIPPDEEKMLITCLDELIERKRLEALRLEQMRLARNEKIKLSKRERELKKLAELKARYESETVDVLT